MHLGRSNSRRFRRVGTSIVSKRRTPLLSPDQPPRATPATDVTVHRGSAVPTAPAISVVVMAIHGDARVVDAVGSLQSDTVMVEIIVVNTGARSLRSLLETTLDRIVLVESPALRLPGGTRNLGVLEARGSVVAFLAADCLAGPGWIDRRLAAHRIAPAVASAILPTPDRDDHVPLTSLASHMLVYARRDAEYPGPRTVRYGVSYHREVLTRHGPFLEDRMDGEDTEFNHRLPEPPVWDSAVVTLHRNPSTLAAALADARHRGVRLINWTSANTRYPTLRALRRIAGTFYYALTMLVYLKGSRRGALLAATPLVCLLALTQVVGALSRRDVARRPMRG